MKDFTGNELDVGDIVAFLEAGYRGMVRGTVIGFTPKQIRIEWKTKNYKGDTEINSCTRERGYVAKIQSKQ